jgi:hypothetical protein
MSDRKQIMVRLDLEDYEILRLHAYKVDSPVSVLARVLIMQSLDNLELERRLTEHDGQDEVSVEPSETSSASSPPRRSPNAKRSKKKKARG